MDPDQHTRAHAFALPVELFYRIFSFLEVGDIFTLRKTCKYLLTLTHDRGLWSTIFTRLRATQALPCSRAEFMAMSSQQAEQVLFAASKLETSFLALRERIAHHLPVMKRPCSSTSASTCSWRVLTFISDRFILSVDNTAVVIWDTSTFASSSAVASSPWAYFTLSNFIDYVDCYSKLYIAVARVHVDHQSAIIYSVPLPPLGVSESHHGCLQWEAEFPLDETELLKHMDPHSGRALLFCPATSMIHILHWRDDNRRSTISIQSDDFDDGWNGITSLRFCGPYILCFRARSVEAYAVPTDGQTANSFPVLRHRFGPVCFRAVSLSHVRVSRRSSGEVYTIFVLGNDVYRGMFHYRIRVAASPVPSMSVQVLSKGGIQLPLIPRTDVGYRSDYRFRRMCVSTWSLGSAGLRGVWVDRVRGHIDRRVVAFTTHPSRLRNTEEAPLVTGEDSDTDSDGDAPDASDEALAIDGKVVHVISSYDLRDDITICAVSEWTGRIALGSRVGDILLL